MSDDFLNSLAVSSKAKKTAYIGLLYGEGGVGKTGIAKYADNPFFLAVENGVTWVFRQEVNGQIPQRFADSNDRTIIPKTADQFFQMLTWLSRKDNRDSLQNPIKTIVIDSLGFLQDLFYNDIVEKNPFTNAKEPMPVSSIIDLGYDGMGMAMPYWKRLLTACEIFRDKGINVILVTHSAYKNIQNQNGESYKIIDMDLQSYGEYNVPSLLKRSVDWCYFVNSETSTVKTGSGKWAKTQAMGRSEARTIVNTRKTSLFYAKSRAVKEDDVPDKYYYGVDDRDEVINEIFKDLDK